MFPYHPLAGVRIIEMCWIWSGPLMGQFLADLGAEVIKIEAHDRFDPYRFRGVERLRGMISEKLRRELSTSFHSLNRNKVGLSVDLKKPEGLEIVKRLAKTSHLLIENFTVGTLERLGLDLDTLHAVNPDLVVISLSSFGAGSRLEALRSYGLVTSALGGFESLLTVDGELVGSPTFVMSDPNAALFGVFGAIAGLVYAQTGSGGVGVRTSQLEAVATILEEMPADEDDQRWLNGIVETADGRHVAITVCGEQRDVEEMAEYCGGHSAEEAIEFIRQVGGYAEVVMDIQLTPGSPVFRDLEVRIEAQHAIAGTEELIASPWRVNGRRPPLRKNAPVLGEGNVYVLRDILGLADAEIEELIRKNVI